MSFHSGIVSPQGVWWKPAAKQEKLWLVIAFAWCMVLFAMMPLWHVKGGQNPSGIRTTVEPSEFEARTQRFIDEYGVDDESGFPTVAPPPGSDLYLVGEMWNWYPAMRLQAGASYTLHISSLDVNHGFGLVPANVNFQIIPGYDYALRITPKEPGEYYIVCNEFCGIGHHDMLGKIVILAAEAGGVS